MHIVLGQQVEKIKLNTKGLSLYLLPLPLSQKDVGNLSKPQELVLLCFTGYGSQRPNDLHR